jgi:hypothetical protein
VGISHYGHFSSLDYRTRHGSQSYLRVELPVANIRAGSRRVKLRAEARLLTFSNNFLAAARSSFLAVGVALVGVPLVGVPSTFVASVFVNMSLIAVIRPAFELGEGVAPLEGGVALDDKMALIFAAAFVVVLLLLRGVAWLSGGVGLLNVGVALFTVGVALICTWLGSTLDFKGNLVAFLVAEGTTAAAGGVALGLTSEVVVSTFNFGINESARDVYHMGI